MDTRVTGIIPAIKFIRGLNFKFESIVDINGTSSQRIVPDITLKEAKDFIENVMSLGGAQKEKIYELTSKVYSLENKNQELQDKLNETKRVLSNLVIKLN